MHARGLLLGTAALVMSAGAVMAADPIIYTPAPPPPFMAPPPAPLFSFAGGYVGGYGTYFLGSAFGGGIQGGFNFGPGNFLFGVEGQLGVLVGGGIGFETNANARAGFVLGQRVLLYGEGGVGAIFSGGFTPFYSVGGGVEFGIGQRTSVGIETKGLGAFGGGITAIRFEGAFNIHLGR